MSFKRDVIVGYLVDVYDVSMERAEWAIDEAGSLDLGVINNWISKNTEW